VTFERDFLSMMDTPIGVASRATTDGFGAITWSAATTVPAHVTYKMNRVLSTTQETVVSSVQFQCPPPAYTVPLSNAIAPGVVTPEIKSNDRVSLPDGTTRHVLNVVIYTDEQGQHHQTVSLE
jgi:hypothetical protein